MEITENRVYPPEFVEAVKQEFPDANRLHAALDANFYIVGRYLDDARQDRITHDEVLKALDQGEAGLAALREHAQRLKRYTELYVWWGDIQYPERASSEG